LFGLFNGDAMCPFKHAIDKTARPGGFIDLANYASLLNLRDLNDFHGL
jgi:hypothetical protein